MITLPNNLQFENHEYKSIFDVVFIRVKNLLCNPLHAHYTGHSIDHSARIIEIVSALIDNTSICLNEAEKLVLNIAILTHDIGMQTPNYEELGVCPLTIDELELLRKKHHEYSELLILESVGLNRQSKYYLGLDSIPEFVDNIALVAKYHRKLDIEKLNDDMVGSNVIRLKLLSSLIRLGDSLDLDYRRVNIDMLSVLEIPVESKFYWFSHHYVNGLRIENQKVQVYFRFPHKYPASSLFQQAIIDYVRREILDQINEVYDLLDSYKIRLYKDVIIHVKQSGGKKEMPLDLEKYVMTLYHDQDVYKGVIYSKLNCLSRDGLMNAYVRSLDNTKSYRNMIMGPTFLSPKWYRERVNANGKTVDFDSCFLDFVKKCSLDEIKNIRLMFTNTDRFEAKTKEHLTKREFKKYYQDIIENINQLWGTNGEGGPLLCCVDPGYMHIVTVSDGCAIITQRPGRLEPTSQGYLTTDHSEIEKIKKDFDSVFDYNYTSQKEELRKLRKFLEEIIGGV